ncbi:Fur family transcriptional regulator [Dokdonella sp. MW10]|uniref:Fur family transcriptional regulator n=1 Tax=Dokdonella sp. MW10 TaxID=2992926 RepID=UPI003F81CEEA
MTQANRDGMALLARHGLRVTRPRLEVLRAFDHHDRLTGEDVYRLLARDASGISMATIYRVLAELAGAHILDRYVLGRGASVFARHRGGHSVHLACCRCGLVEACDDEHASAALAMLAASRGFVIAEAGVVVKGVCIACAASPDEDVAS